MFKYSLDFVSINPVTNSAFSGRLSDANLIVISSSECKSDSSTNLNPLSSAYLSASVPEYP